MGNGSFRTRRRSQTHAPLLPAGTECGAGNDRASRCAQRIRELGLWLKAELGTAAGHAGGGAKRAMATMTLMAEPGPAADKTVGLSNDETVAVPNSAAPDAADLAWSSGDDNDVQRDAAGDRQSWRATWRIAAALVAAGLVLAGAIIFGRSLLTSHTNAAPKPAAPSTPKDGATPAPTAPATASAPSAAPSSIVSTPDQEQQVHSGPQRPGHLIRQFFTPPSRERQDGMRRHPSGNLGAADNRGVSCE